MTQLPQHDEDLLMLSGIQHFAFCRRQWALIHVENVWVENGDTIDGQFAHDRCHDEALREHRGDLIIVRGLRVSSKELQLSGICDVVEFSRSKNGITLQGERGQYAAMPVEYKKGHQKHTKEDEVQLCAQVLALEEMFRCSIAFGALFYSETKKRVLIEINDALRNLTRKYAREMLSYYVNGYVPKPTRRKACDRCSLVDICLPVLETTKNVKRYIEDGLSQAGENE